MWFESTRRLAERGIGRGPSSRLARRKGVGDCTVTHFSDQGFDLVLSAGYQLVQDFAGQFWGWLDGLMRIEHGMIGNVRLEAAAMAILTMFADDVWVREMGLSLENNYMPSDSSVWIMVDLSVIQRQLLLLSITHVSVRLGIMSASESSLYQTGHTSHNQNHVTTCALSDHANNFLKNGRILMPVT